MVVVRGKATFRFLQSRYLNIFSIFNKEAVEKERLRLGDELNRGYFDDYRDLKKHGGKLATASQSLLPIAASLKFPTLTVNTAVGKVFTLPEGKNDSDEKSEISCSTNPLVTMICLAFRGNGQVLVKPWILPFINSFKTVKEVKIYEVSYIDSWFLSLPPVRYLLLRSMQPKPVEEQKNKMEQLVYAFGDSYYFRKSLHITNLLTGYIFLLDKEGRVRWRAYGKSTEEEVSSMIACTHRLLDEQKQVSG